MMNLKKILYGAIREFQPGEIAVIKDRNNSDRFVIHVYTNNDRISKIITKEGTDENSSIIEKNVPVTSLNKYSSVNPPDQTFDPNKSSLNEEPIETYVISVSRQ